MGKMVLLYTQGGNKAEHPDFLMGTEEARRPERSLFKAPEGAGEETVNTELYIRQKRSSERNTK